MSIEKGHICFVRGEHRMSATIKKLLVVNVLCFITMLGYADRYVSDGSGISDLDSSGLGVLVHDYYDAGRIDQTVIVHGCLDGDMYPYFKDDYIDSYEFTAITPVITVQVTRGDNPVDAIFGGFNLYFYDSSSTFTTASFFGVIGMTDRNIYKLSGLVVGRRYRMSLRVDTMLKGSFPYSVTLKPFFGDEENYSTYAIKFVRNEGSGYIKKQSFRYGVKSRIPSIKSLGWTRRGYTFKGWATSTANARNGKIWKKDWAYVSTAATVGKTLTVYAVWKLTPGYYSIRFNKNDGTGKWRELGYKYGDNTTLPTIANGLQWSRAGYKFGGWATSAANAAKGIAWRGDKGVTRTPVAAGKTLNVYAIWKKIGAAAMTVNAAFAPSPSAQSLSSSSGANTPAKLLPGYYSGELADGTGMYDLLVDESGEKGYVNIVCDDGSAITEFVDVCFLGDVIVVIDEFGMTYNLVK